jgi:hypothetical protein
MYIALLRHQTMVKQYCSNLNARAEPRSLQATDARHTNAVYTVPHNNTSAQEDLAQLTVR